MRLTAPLPQFTHLPLVMNLTEIAIACRTFIILVEAGAETAKATGAK